MGHGAHAKDDTLKIIGIWRATQIMEAIEELQRKRPIDGKAVHLSSEPIGTVRRGLILPSHLRHDA